MKKWAKQTGFTIVELLIVIVVIGILAAITIVAYNGIQSRANDNAVRSDLTNFAKKVRVAEVDLGAFPAGGAVRTGSTDTGDAATSPNVTYKATRSAYNSSVNNFYYCTGKDATTGVVSFRFYAKSKSGSTWRYASDSGFQNLGDTTFASGNCLAGYADGGSWSYGYNATNGTWASWTN
jgi:prepilin-type N-terminal cleavage/methylation domain-containing protein